MILKDPSCGRLFVHVMLFLLPGNTNCDWLCLIPQENIGESMGFPWFSLHLFRYPQEEMELSKSTPSVWGLSDWNVTISVTWWTNTMETRVDYHGFTIIYHKKMEMSINMSIDHATNHEKTWKDHQHYGIDRDLPSNNYKTQRLSQKGPFEIFAQDIDWQCGQHLFSSGMILKNHPERNTSGIQVVLVNRVRIISWVLHIKHFSFFQTLSWGPRVSCECPTARPQGRCDNPKDGTSIATAKRSCWRFRWFSAYGSSMIQRCWVETCCKWRCCTS